MNSNGYSDIEIHDTLAIQDALEANAIDFAWLMKQRGMTAENPGYPAFARQFALAMISNEKLRLRAL